MNKTNKILLSLGLASWLAGCSRDESQYSPIDRAPDAYKNSWIELKNRDTADTVVAIDLDKDGSIDEALQLHGVTFGNVMGPALADQLGDIKKQQWIHLIADGYQGKAVLTTPNTRTMTAEERANLTGANKAVSRWDSIFKPYGTFKPQ